MRFRDLATVFLSARASHIAQTTYALYRRNLTLHILPVVGDLRIDAVRCEHVEEVLTSASNHSRTKKHGNKLADAALRNIWSAISMCLQYAVRNDWLARNVAARVQPPQRTPREPIMFSPEMLKRILDALVNSEVEGPAVFALGTGARRGEICALRWSDIDLQHSTFAVSRSAANVGRDIIYKVPKTKKSVRTDALPQFVTEMLSKLRSQDSNGCYSTVRSAAATVALVFTRADGSPWDPNELSRKFSRLIHAKLLGPFRFHDLRHANASIAFEVGVPPLTISESLGHSNLTITSNTYVHLTSESKRQKADRIDEYFSRI